MSSRAILAVELAERIALLEDELRRLPRTVWGVVVSIDPSVDVLIDGFGTPVREVALEIGRVAVGERVKVSAQGTSYTIVGVAGDARNERVDGIEVGLDELGDTVAEGRSVLEDHGETLGVIGGLVEAIQEHNTNIVDPFIQDADHKLSVELPAAQQAASEAGASALAAVTTANRAKAKADVAVTSSVVEYALSDSRATPPVTGWSVDSPTPTQALPFVWLRTQVTYGNGDAATTSPAVTTGPEGDKGVSVSAITPYFQLAKNYAPDITVPGAKVEIARNLAKNPFCVSGGGVIPVTNNSNYYSAVLTSDLPAPHPLGITTGMVGERLSSGGSTILSVYRLDGYITNNAPADRKIGVWIYVNNDGYRAASALSNDWGSLELPANEWVFVTTVNTVLSTYNSGISISRVGTSPAEGDKAWITGIVSVDASKDTVPGRFFGGTISDDPDFTSEWAGAENNSESILYGVRPVIDTSALAIAVMSSWEGQPAVRLIPNNESNSSYQRLLSGSGFPTAIQQKSHTLAGTFGQKAPQQGAINTSYQRKIWTQSPGPLAPTVPNVAGTQRIVYARAATTSRHAMYIGNGASIGNGDVWWSDLGLYEGDLAVPTIKNPPGWTTSQPTYPNNGEPYDILTTERVDYDNGTFTWTPVTKVPLVTGPRGQDGLPGKDGVGITDTVITYAQSTSGTTAPTSGWAANPPTPVAGRYVWTKTVWTYSDNTTETGYSVGKIGDTGDKGTTGDKGDTGVSVTSVNPYYRMSASEPTLPTGSAPTGWSTTQPTFVAGQKLWRSERVELSNGTYQWTPVTEVKSFNVAVDAQETAGEALHLANLAEQLAEGMVWVGPEEPPHELRVEGQVWIETDTFDGEDGPEERMVAIRSLEDPEPLAAVWQTYTTITGLLIVPGEDGIPTIIDQSGITVGTAMAESIGVGALAADSVGAKQIILGEVKKSHLDPHLEGVLDDAEDLAERVVILPSSITISRSRVGGSGPLTALRLEADRLSFIVDDEPAAYINASTRVMHIDNAIFTESVQIGEHQVRKLGDQGVTIFTWNGGA